jgi:hypothetical protein
MAGYGWLTDFRSMSAGVLLLVIGLALVGDLAESWLGVGREGRVEGVLGDQRSRASADSAC